MSKQSLNISAYTDKLKELIAKYPDFPIVVLCDPEVCLSEDMYYYAPSVSFKIGEILDCEQDVNENLVYSDRIRFEEDLSEKLAYLPEYEYYTDEQLDRIIEDELKEYEPYWRNAIIIRASV